MKSIVLGAILLLFAAAMSLLSDNRERIYDCFISDNMGEWKKIIDEIDKQSQMTNQQRLELVNYQYGYIAWCMGKKKYKLAEQYLEKAESNLTYLENKKYSLSTLCVYRSIFYGYRVGISRWQAPFLASKIVDYSKQAAKLDSNNWFAYMQLGNVDFYTPTFMGGSKSNALKLYLKAEKLLESNKSNLINNWNYLNLLTVIGNTYLELKNYSLAKKYYDKALSIEPNFYWIKVELYPILNSKINSQNE